MKTKLINYLELDSFNINKLIGNPKLLYDYKSMNVIKTIVVLKDGRIAIGQEIGEAYEVLTHPTGISIFDPNTYQEIFFIEKLGGNFIELKNGNLLVQGVQKEIHKVKLNSDSFDVLQTIQLKYEIQKQMTELSNQYFSISSSDTILIYKKSNEKYSLDHEVELKGHCRMNIKGNKDELI